MKVSIHMSCEVTFSVTMNVASMASRRHTGHRQTDRPTKKNKSSFLFIELIP